MKQVRLILFVLTLNCSFSSAQLDSMQFKKYTTTHGLSDNVVTAISQDDEGYLWIGTSNGLNRFDGTKFQNYWQGLKPFQLPGNYVSKLIRLSGGCMGVVTRRGFMKLNYTNYTGKNYLLKDSSFFHTYLNSVNDAVELGNKKYALSTHSGFYVFNEDGSIYFRHDAYTAKDHSTKRIAYGRDMFKLNENEVLLYTHDQPIYFNCDDKKITSILPDNKRYAPFLLNKNNWTIHTQINNSEYLFFPLNTDSIYYYDRIKNKKTASAFNFSAKKELYWASFIFPYNDTTFLMNGKHGGVFTFYLNKTSGKIRFESKKQLQNERCNWIFKDRENRLWIGTDNGLLKQDLQKSVVKAWFFNDSRETTGNAYFDNITIADGYIFMTRSSKEEALYMIDSKTMRLKKKLSFYQGHDYWNMIINMRQYHPDTLWISCVPGIVWLNLKNFNYGKVKLPEELQNKALVLGALNQNNDAWMCGYLKNLAVCYSAKTREFKSYSTATHPPFSFSKPKHIVYDAHKNVWFGGHGLSRFNTQTQTFDTLMHYFAGANKFEDNILCVSPDPYGSLWFHVVENGLVQYQTEQKKYTIFSMEHGIPSGQILLMSPVINNKLWFGTRQKLIQFDIQNHSLITLAQEDGLPDENFTGSEIFHDTLSGKLYAAMNNHLISFPSALKETINYQKQIKPDVLFLNNASFAYHPGDTLHLNYDQNNISLQVSILDFETKTPYQLSYTLNDTLNNYMVDEPLIRLVPLDYGTNSLTLKARNKYNKELRRCMVIVIKPPFWHTWWFILLCSITGAGLIYLLIKLRLKKLNQEAKLNQQLSEFELKALHAQMNPHFIFNCLNSIKSLILYKRNEEATLYLNKFSSLVRQNLDHSRKQFLTLQQNIDYIKQYIEIESLRFSDLKYQIDVAPDVDSYEIKIAPMLLQPLIENAIWHGLQAIQGDKRLSIAFSVVNSLIVCKIEDNGVGINQTQTQGKKEHNSIGIQNIRQRITLLNEKYNLDYTLEIKDRSSEVPAERGTIALLSFNSI